MFDFLFLFVFGGGGVQVAAFGEQFFEVDVLSVGDFIVVDFNFGEESIELGVGVVDDALGVLAEEEGFFFEYFLEGVFEPEQFSGRPSCLIEDAFAYSVHGIL